MKKWLLGLLIACMLLTASAALADEVSIKLIDSKADKQMEWLSGTDYIIVGDYGKRALADQDGNKLTQSIYNFFSDVYVDRGIISGTDSDGDWGVMNTDLEILVPFDYKETYIFNKNWVMCTPHSSSAKLEFWNLRDGKLAFTMLPKQYESGFSPPGCELLLVEEPNGKVRVYNLQGKQVDTTDSLYGYEDAKEVKDYETFKLYDGTSTMVDLEGNMVIVPDDYDQLSTYDGWFFRATRDGKTGVVDGAGNVIIPFHKDNQLKYTSYTPARHPGFVGGGYGSVVRNDKLYFYDFHGELTASFDDSFDGGKFSTSHASAFSTKKEGSAVILAADGKKSTVKYDKYFRVVDNGSGYFYLGVNEDYDYALYDWHGNQLLPYEYSDFLISGDGWYLLAKRDDSKYAEMYEISYPEVWYEMYADDMREPHEEYKTKEEPASSASSSDQPSLSALVSALEKGVQEADSAQSGKKQGGILSSDTAVRPGTQQPEPTKSTGLLVSNTATPTPAPAAQPTPAPAAAPAAPGAASGLLESAKLLLQTDAAGNSAAIVQLINTAAEMLSGTNAAGLLQSAAMLAQTNAAQNAAAIVQLLDTAAGMQ
ncbi:MAG: hypothetical protein PUD16_14180 [bacterium]|nr:hypothetical protein [bacterium]